MDSLLKHDERKPMNLKALFAGGAIGGILLAAGIYLLTLQPSMADQQAAVLEGSYTEGSPEFDRITKNLIISRDVDNTIVSPNAFGGISIFISGKIRNKGADTINGLEINVAVVDQFNEAVKDKRVLVIPTQQPQLGPDSTIPVTLTIDGLKRTDDRANIRWKVTAIRTASGE